MRDSAFGGIFKFFLLGMLVLAVAGLVLMDIGGFFTGNMTPGTIVKGGGVNIGASEFNRTLDRVLSRQGIPAEQAYQMGLVDNVLKSEIQNRLFIKETHDLGLEINDEDVLDQISKIAEPLAKDGRSKKEVLQQILRTQGITEAEFVNGLRQEMASTLLRSVLQPPASLTSPLLAENLYRYDNESRKADIIFFRNSAVKDASKPTEDQLKKYYEANKADFLIPETRKITMATLKSDMVKKNLTVTDEQLQAEYDRNIASFTKPARRMIDQIVLKTEDEAKKAMEEMNAGQTPKNTMTSEYEQSALLPEIGGPVFAAKKDAVLGPIQTDLGWHVIKVKDTLPEKVTPFAEVKDRLKTELENIGLSEELYSAGNTIEDRIAGGESFDEIVKEYGMTTDTIGPFRQNGNDAGGNDVFKSFAADREKIVLAAYDYEQGEVAPLVETADGQFHMIRIDAVTPDTYRPYESVRTDLEKRWVEEQQRLAAKAAAKTALEALNGGKNITEVAKENGLSVQSITHRGRKTEAPKPLTPVAAAQMFSTDIGKGFSSTVEDGVIVGTVTDITLPPATAQKDEKELSALTELTGKALSEDALSQFVAKMVNAKKIKINQAALEQMYGGQGQQQ